MTSTDTGADEYEYNETQETLLELKQKLKGLNGITPEKFQKLDDYDKLSYLPPIFNEYLEEVAIPKGWEITKHIRQWPMGYLEGERIDPELRAKNPHYDIVISKEKHDAIQQALTYPDFVLFGMRKYRMLIDNDISNPARPRLKMVKFSKTEAAAFIREIEDETSSEPESQSQTPPKTIVERWDEESTKNKALLSDIERLDELSREHKAGLMMYIIMDFAKWVGIPIMKRNRDFDTDLKAIVEDNDRILEEVQKQPDNLFFFALQKYGVMLTIGKDKGKDADEDEDRFMIEKMPQEIMDLVSDYLADKKAKDKDREMVLTEEETEELWQKIFEMLKQLDKEKKNRDKSQDQEQMK